MKDGVFLLHLQTLSQLAKINDIRPNKVTLFQIQATNCASQKFLIYHCAKRKLLNIFDNQWYLAGSAPLSWAGPFWQAISFVWHYDTSSIHQAEPANGSCHRWGGCISNWQPYNTYVWRQLRRHPLVKWLQSCNKVLDNWGLKTFSELISEFSLASDGYFNVLLYGPITVRPPDSNSKNLFQIWFVISEWIHQALDTMLGSTKNESPYGP